jgi:hypothetical protein
MVCDNDLVDFQCELRDCEAEVDTLQICSRGMRGVSSRVVGVAGLARWGQKAEAGKSVYSRHCLA